MKYEIDIEGLPEGWKPKAFRGRVRGEYFINIIGRVEISHEADPQPRLIVEKIHPRRIVLEILRCDYNVMPGEFYGDTIAGFSRNNHDEQVKTLHLPKTIWREVK